MVGFADIEHAAAEVAAGRPVIVVDDEHPETAGYLVHAAQLATPELLAFTIRHTAGFVAVPLTVVDADRLSLPPMYYVNQNRSDSDYAVTVDAREGVTSGVSAADRAHTIRLLADPATRPTDLVRPGHVVPLRARQGGVLERRGPAEAAIDLARLAELHPAGVLCELVNDDGTIMRRADLERFAAEHHLALISVAELFTYRRRTEVQVERVAEARLPTDFGVFQAVGYRSGLDDAHHMALVYGDLADGRDVIVRIHSECLTGDVFGSSRCECRSELRRAMRRVSTEGRGVILYLRRPESMCNGHELRPYPVRDTGDGVVNAAVARSYGDGAQILIDLGVKSVRILTGGAAERAELEAYGLEVGTS